MPIFVVLVFLKNQLYGIWIKTVFLLFDYFVLFCYFTKNTIRSIAIKLLPSNKWLLIQYSSELCKSNSISLVTCRSSLRVG